MTVNERFVTKSRAELPVVPLRDMVVFPHMMAPFIVGRPDSVKALEETLSTSDKRIFLITQKDPQVDDPTRSDLYDIGVVAKVVQNMKIRDDNIKVMVEGVQRAALLDLEEEDGCFVAELEILDVDYPAGDKVSEYMGNVLSTFEQYAKGAHHLAFESLASTLETDDPDRFADTLAAHLMVETSEKQELLELINPYERLRKLDDLLDFELEKLSIDKRINVQVKKQMEKAQKEYYLNEKIKAIHEELGRKGEKGDEIEELRQRIAEADLPDEVRERAEQELPRLEAMPPVSAETTVSRNYIDWLITVPWTEESEQLEDLDEAERILNEDHHGLEKIKERIVEFLAVRQLTDKTQTSIICFVGPPGVGKSSLAKSIARATGREFVRQSLGGVRDEAEIRGHRRTYIGSFPGQIIQMMKKAGTVNPVFLLDEVDKMSTDFRGDPASALLEVLDPEQNHAFVDHYLDVEYDLSKVMFIATANVLHPIPPALQDRMEVIKLSGYTMGEKLAIGSGFLVPKQLDKHGLDDELIDFDEEGLRALIEKYTREAGVRNLEREIASVCRKIARRVLREGDGDDVDGYEPITVDSDLVTELLGKRKFRPRRKKEESEVGVATGLAWTDSGGELLETEVGLMKGKGKLTLTGSLGDIMKESARAAVSYTRSRAEILGIDPEFSDETDIHIHVPEGSIPKDGPSAGITMATALVSALTDNPVRKNVAMTGEITLRGKVLPVGGIKDKVLAAYRADIPEVILPKENDKDLEDISEEARDTLEIHLVESMDEVLRLALDSDLVSMPKQGGDFDARSTDAASASADSMPH